VSQAFKLYVYAVLSDRCWVWEVFYVFYDTLDGNRLYSEAGF
jgi:hypothetical protein